MASCLTTKIGHSDLYFMVQCLYLLSAKKQTTKFSFANFKSVSSPSYIISRLQKQEHKSVDLDEVAHYGPTHQDLRFLQIQLYSHLWYLKNKFILGNFVNTKLRHAITWQAYKLETNSNKPLPLMKKVIYPGGYTCNSNRGSKSALRTNFFLILSKFSCIKTFVVGIH